MNLNIYSKHLWALMTQNTSLFKYKNMQSPVNPQIFIKKWLYVYTSMFNELYRII